jgi:superfamily II DNA or RNA helicase
VQREALAALEQTRLEGFRRGLVVMATGLGKTWLAAFDAARPQFRQVLFVAHREEILRQSLEVFRHVQPDADLGLYYGGEKQPEARVLFAGVQALAGNLHRFAPGRFGYIVVDEFHHAAARSYRRVIGHFQPGFMLGLTATPNRMDGADLLALCSDNLVYECPLTEGVERGDLSPFRYFHALSCGDLAAKSVAARSPRACIGTVSSLGSDRAGVVRPLGNAVTDLQLAAKDHKPGLGLAEAGGAR